MDSEKLPMTSMKEFKKEVLWKSGEAGLPCNLSDRWLELLERDLSVISSDDKPEDEVIPYAPAPISLVMRLISAKQNNKTVDVDMDKMFEYLDLLKIEIDSEIINRSNTGIYIKPATLKNIFEDNRKIQWTLTPELKADLLAGRIKIDDL